LMVDGRWLAVDSINGRLYFHTIISTFNFHFFHFVPFHTLYTNIADQ
jgi:hypothetical protein